VISEDFLRVLRNHGVIRAYVFGSVARGEERPDSDLDLLVHFSQPTPLFDQLDLANELSALVGRKIDLMTQVDPAFAPYILPTLLPLPPASS
jgi:predicted nucleotidyltransferase